MASGGFYSPLIPYNRAFKTSSRLSWGMKIIVNAMDRQWGMGSISYPQLVGLAFPGAPSEHLFTIQYSRGHDENREGLMTPGETVMLTEDMVFDVTWTGNA